MFYMGLPLYALANATAAHIWLVESFVQIVQSHTHNARVHITPYYVCINGKNCGERWFSRAKPNPRLEKLKTISENATETAHPELQLITDKRQLKHIINLNVIAQLTLRMHRIFHSSGKVFWSVLRAQQRNGHES